MHTVSRARAWQAFALLLAGLLVGASAAYVDARRDARAARSDASSARAGLRVTVARLEAARRQLESVRQELARANAAAREQAHVRIRECSRPGTQSVRVRVVSPAEAAIVTSPVLVHLQVVEPPGCDATYHVTVDGIPFQPLDEMGVRAPFTARNPEPTRPLRKADWEFACVSTTYAYLAIEVPPGRHILRVGSCPQGTGVPATEPVAVGFRVIT